MTKNSPLLRSAVLAGLLLALTGHESAHAQTDAAPDADEAGSPADTHADIGLVFGGKVGGGIGAPVSEFGATPVFELELGYMLPLPAPVGRSLELFLSGQYTQPGMDGLSSEADPRLPGDGLVAYDVTQQELTLSLGALYRFDVGSDLLMPYGGIGGRIYLLNTKVKGNIGGQASGENEETQTAAGLLVLGGLDIFVGPGALLAELSFGWGGVDAFVLRDTNVGSLNLAVGYRLMI